MSERVIVLDPGKAPVTRVLRAVDGETLRALVKGDIEIPSGMRAMSPESSHRRIDMVIHEEGRFVDEPNVWFSPWWPAHMQEAVHTAHAQGSLVMLTDPLRMRDDPTLVFGTIVFCAADVRDGVSHGLTDREHSVVMQSIMPLLVPVPDVLRAAFNLFVRGPRPDGEWPGGNDA